MKDEILDKYQEAGLIAAKILRDGAKEIRIGAPYLDIVESIESRVIGEGAALAFPLNLSLNEDAAHDTASTGDTGRSPTLPDTVSTSTSFTGHLQFPTSE